MHPIGHEKTPSKNCSSCGWATRFATKNHYPEGIQGSRGMELKDPGIGVEGSSCFYTVLFSYHCLAIHPRNLPQGKKARKIPFIQLPKRKPRRFNARPWVQWEQHTSPPFLRRLVDSLPRTLEDGTPLSKWRRRVPNQFKNLLVGWLPNKCLLTTLGPQNHEKWRFWTPNRWVITPKNQGCGFPWHLLNGMILQGRNRSASKTRLDGGEFHKGKATRLPRLTMLWHFHQLHLRRCRDVVESRKWSDQGSMVLV